MRIPSHFVTLPGAFIADLVLFDEPTSRLDALNEAIILRSIHAMAVGEQHAACRQGARRGCGAGLPPRIRHAHC